MKASYNWLREFVQFDISPVELGDRLTLAGLEVEAMEDTGDDTIYDLGITPNRPDWLSMRGIAREIAAILGTTFRDMETGSFNEKGDAPRIRIEDSDLCHRYCSRIIRGVKPGPSPEWLARRLESCGIRSMSNIVDVTNYVLLEIGQPLHAFDLNRLAGGMINVKRAGGEERFTTLDGIERSLDSEYLMIWDAEKPVALAGVMGGQNTEVSEDTVDILIESAWFFPSSIRRTSRALGLSTESSYRFERGVDKEAVSEALDRAASLIAELAGGVVSPMTDIYPVPYESRSFDISCRKVSSLVGVEFSGDHIKQALQSLHCGVSGEGDLLTVTPPSFRVDLKSHVDVAEEVARLYGYEKIPATLPVMHMSAAPENRRMQMIRFLRRSMTGAGFSEAVNFSFLNPRILDSLNLGEDDRRRSLVMIRNPLRQEESALRTSLVPALLHNVALNLSRGEKSLRLFEISKVFFNTGERLPDEILQMAAVIQKDKTPAFWKDPRPAFFEMKGAIEKILGEMKVRDVRFLESGETTEPYLHPGKSCAIEAGGKRVGVIGMLHPSVIEGYELSGDIAIAELFDLDSLASSAESRIKFSPIPRFPHVDRDVAFVVDRGVSVASIERQICQVDSDLIESVRVFDIYEGKSLPENKKSVAFTIRYRSQERTLTDAEVEDVHNAIIGRVRDRLGAELR
jgi:phenylalanyl-tRNA synthetase beta chain